MSNETRLCIEGSAAGDRVGTDYVPKCLWEMRLTWDTNVVVPSLDGDRRGKPLLTSSTAADAAGTSLDAFLEEHLSKANSLKSRKRSRAVDDARKSSEAPADSMSMSASPLKAKGKPDSEGGAEVNQTASDPPFTPALLDALQCLSQGSCPGFDWTPTG